MKFVKDDEKVGINGMYRGNWNLTIRTTVETEAELKDLVGKIPHLQHFKCIVIE